MDKYFSSTDADFFYQGFKETVFRFFYQSQGLHDIIFIVSDNHLVPNDDGWKGALRIETFNVIKNGLSCFHTQHIHVGEFIFNFTFAKQPFYVLAMTACAQRVKPYIILHNASLNYGPILRRRSKGNIRIETYFKVGNRCAMAKWGVVPLSLFVPVE